MAEHTDSGTAVAVYEQGLGGELEAARARHGLDLTRQMPTVKLGMGSTPQLKVREMDHEGEGVERGDVVGVVLGSQPYRERWIGEYDPSVKKSPLCVSPDGITGIGDNSLDGSGEGVHRCWTCPMADYEHLRATLGEDGAKRESCQNRTRVFVLNNENVTPTAIDLSPMSLWPFSRFSGALENKRRATWSVLARAKAALDPKKNKNRIYFTTERPLTESELRAVESYAEVWNVIAADRVKADQRQAVKNARERLGDPDAVFDLGEGNVETGDLDDDRGDRPLDRFGVPVSAETAAEWESIEEMAESEVDGDPPAFG